VTEALVFYSFCALSGWIIVRIMIVRDELRERLRYKK